MSAPTEQRLRLCPKCKRIGMDGAGGVYSCLYCGWTRDSRRPSANKTKKETKS